MAIVGPLRVAIIGAGPAGIYAAGALLDSGVPVSIDLFEALPTPFGLVRYGVAPDHPKIRSVSTKLAEILGSPRVRFLGNVTYGTDLTPEDVQQHYHAVIHAIGSPNERALGIPGETLPGSFTAGEFVAWYNGLPGAVDGGFVNARDAVVAGAGNVALDVARMLVTGAEALVLTDLPADVLDAWRSARATNVYVLARRGPAYAKFTTPELRELADLDRVGLIVDASDLELDATGEAELARNRVAKRNLAVLQRWAGAPGRSQPRRIHFRFWTRPTEILGTDRVDGVAVERTRLDEAGRLVPAGAAGVLPAQSVFRAIGYAGRAIPGLPFDEVTATVPHRAGRVTGGSHPGAYVAGWIKRGPTGVIGTNRSDAAETVRTLLREAAELPEPPEPEPDAVLATLDRAGVRYFAWSEWVRLDEHEVAAGRRIGRPRLKVSTVEKMLSIGAGAQAERGAPSLPHR